MFGTDNDEDTGVAVDSVEIIAQYQTVRIRALWTSYKRILQLTKESVRTLDPAAFKVTNNFTYGTIGKITPDEKIPEQFSMEVEKTIFVYKTSHRSQLLCQLFECIFKNSKIKSQSRPCSGQRVHKNGSRSDCKLIATPYAIVELDCTERTVQEYHWVNIAKLGIDDNGNSCLFFVHSGRTKLFILEELHNFVLGCKLKLKALGLENVDTVEKLPMSDLMQARFAQYASLGSAVAIYSVNKHTQRNVRPVPRQLHINGEYVIEKDSSGFQLVSFHKVTSIYALIRSWSNQREFTIEYEDGSSRTFTCSLRDTLLATLLDVCHASNNLRVIVTGEMSDGLRLMPRFADEDYKSSIADAFFGASSIEAWFLAKLAKSCKSSPLLEDSVVEACKELNANVPCPGISPNSDPTLVKNSLAGILKLLNALVLSSVSDDRNDQSRSMAIILQSLYRIIPSTQGFKSFVEVKEIDSRLLLLQLLRFDKDFVNYWTLEVLMVLCRCPILPRNNQQEFVNKHTLLTDKMLAYLIDLMSDREEEDTSSSQLHISGSLLGHEVDHSLESDRLRAASQGEAEFISAIHAPVDCDDFTTLTDAIPANPSNLAHIPVEDTKILSPSRKMSLRQTTNANLSERVASFAPNSLVIVGAAALLESVVCSKRDTSSPELLNKVLDMLCTRFEVLTHMLRSNAFIIIENSSILMFVLLKNRPMIAVPFREMALSDCLVLKHFYYAVFSASVAQRFISRFLIATWMAGPSATNPAKSLLVRIIPSGLIEYLKHVSITEEHRKNLDEMEEEFYASFNGTVRISSNFTKAPSQSTKSNDFYLRMRKKISSVLKEASIDKLSRFPSAGDSLLSPSTNFVGDNFRPSSMSIALSKSHQGPPTGPENYRIMFHVMTQDHKLPDLIWNDQTRMELRSTLDAELSEFDREQHLRGLGKIAWNYQQFFVKYDSIGEELQVGNIYIHYFLEAGDAFLRALQNPSHVVLFEKLFRRVLANVERNTPLSIMCARCLCRLYSVCRDIIGPFDDMLLAIRILEQASNLELQHCIIDLVELLAEEEANLQQLLDKDIVSIIIKYASLAHLNPDQIGNVLARATANVLMIKDSSTSKSSLGTSTNGESLGNQNDNGLAAFDDAIKDTDDSNLSQEEIVRRKKRYLWVPDDFICPRIWFVAPSGANFPPKQELHRGPFRVTELLDMVDRKIMDQSWLAAPSIFDDFDADSFEAVVDTGRWKPVSEYFQLRMQMLFPGNAVYTPAEVAMKALNMLVKIAAVHRSANSRGVPFFPIPTSKKIMSNHDQLAVFAQLLLSNDTHVVEGSADLLRSLVEFNDAANSKIYLTGLFFFGCRYTGNNFLPIALLFQVSHLKQSFHDTASSVARDLPISLRSILGSILPAAIINMLVNYGPQRFATIFTGEFDTPEVIWSAELRKQCVEMIDIHIGNLGIKLRQFTLAKYEYCPIAKIHYASLEKEIYVHEYYLRNLCDEIRFPDWPIGDPLILLRECIEKWRVELSKGVVDTSISSAKKLLGLKEKYDNIELRKAYKTMARQYHPDKNPNGREMFEKIHQAYELLSSVELQVNETDAGNIVLLMKTQAIIYRRFPSAVADQKYPAYPLLISVLDGITLDGSSYSTSDMEVVTAAVMLMFYTCSVSPLNVREFVKAGAVQKLHHLINYGLQAFESADLEMRAMTKELIIFSCKTLTVVALYDKGRDEMYSLCPAFANDIYGILCLDKQIPLGAENSLETIARSSAHEGLQQAYIDAGVVWKMIPMLLAYDGTLQDDYSDESQRAQANQISANMHAILATKSLGRLGGYMFDDLASPCNDSLRRNLDILLTQPLAKLLRNRRPWELLGALNENVEKATKIWNVSMRSELFTFVLDIGRDRPKGSTPGEMDKHCSSFSFTALRNELCVGGVYVRIFNKTGDTVDIDNPSNFCKDLVKYIWSFTDPSIPTIRQSDIRFDFQELTCEALSILASKHDYVAFDIAKEPKGLETAFYLLDRNPDDSSFKFTAHLMMSFAALPELIDLILQHQPPLLWRLLKAAMVVTTPGAHSSDLWGALEALSTHPDAVAYFIDVGAIPRLLGLIFGVADFISTFQNRLSAISLLSKLLWNPIKGSEASNMLRRFLPEPVVLLLRSKAGNASLEVLDTVVENPEFIWTKVMQSELRDAISSLLGSLDVVKSAGFDQPINVNPDFTVKYAQLLHEIYVGGVYIRLYLKQPTFRLSNPILFTERLVEFWESSFSLQVPEASNMSRTPASEDSSDSRALILGNEDFISLLTSCIICTIKSEPSIIDHLINWGFPHNVVKLLERSLNAGRRGTPVTACIRIISQLSNRCEIVDNFASSNRDLILQLTRVLDVNDVRLLSSTSLETTTTTTVLPADAAFIVELLKKIFQTSVSQYLGYFGAMAINAKLPYFVLDHVIGATPAVLENVKNPSALRVHSVDLIKAIIAGDPVNGFTLQSLLDLHPAWTEFKDQNHDLFITDQEKTDYFLVEDASGSKFAGLLTDGKVSDGISKYFASSSSSIPSNQGHGHMRGIAAESKESASNGNQALFQSSRQGNSGVSSPLEQQPLVGANVIVGAKSINTPSADFARPTSPILAVVTASEDRLSIGQPVVVPSSDLLKSSQRTSIAPPAESSNLSPLVSTKKDSASPMTTISLEKKKRTIKVIITKTEHGIGLDLIKTIDGGVSVQRLKDMPDGSPNPASICSPPVLVGDIIVGVNEVGCSQFTDVVKAIRGSSVKVCLLLTRLEDC